MIKNSYPNFIIFKGRCQQVHIHNLLGEINFSETCRVDKFNPDYWGHLNKKEGDAVEVKIYIAQHGI